MYDAVMGDGHEVGNSNPHEWKLDCVLFRPKDKRMLGA